MSQLTLEVFIRPAGSTSLGSKVLAAMGECPVSWLLGKCEKITFQGWGGAAPVASS